MSASYGVISWKMQGGDPLDSEELEVCKLNALIIKNASIPRLGVTVMLQFKQTLWEGSILSVHGMIKIFSLNLSKIRDKNTNDGRLLNTLV